MLWNVPPHTARALTGVCAHQLPSHPFSRTLTLFSTPQPEAKVVLWGTEAVGVHTQGDVLISILWETHVITSQMPSRVVCCTHLLFRSFIIMFFNLSWLAWPRVHIFSILLWLLLNIKNYSFHCGIKCSLTVALSESCHFPACLKRSVERMLLVPTRPLHLLSPHSLLRLECRESWEVGIISPILWETKTFQKKSLPKLHKGRESVRIDCRLTAVWHNGTAWLCFAFLHLSVSQRCCELWQWPLKWLKGSWHRTMTQ